VAPNTRVAYVPTTALLLRRAALDDVSDRGSEGDEVFDPTLAVAGEDVDLVWRLHETGWRIRYDPSVQVRHLEPETWTGLLGRRFRYGTSAAPLALRHPGALPPLVLFPWPTLTVAAALARRPTLSAAAYACSVLSIVRALRRANQPADGVPLAMLDAAYQTWLGIGRYGTKYGFPLLVIGAFRAGRKRRHEGWASAAVMASLALGPALAEWAGRRGRSLDPVRFVLGRLADDLAYGSGVWAGCVTHRTPTPLLPAIRWHSLRVDNGQPQRKGPR
jgi:hypothetical protein